MNRILYIGNEGFGTTRGLLFLAPNPRCLTQTTLTQTNGINRNKPRETQRNPNNPTNRTPVCANNPIRKDPLRTQSIRIRLKSCFSYHETFVCPGCPFKIFEIPVEIAFERVIGLDSRFSTVKKVSKACERVQTGDRSMLEIFCKIFASPSRTRSQWLWGYPQSFTTNFVFFSFPRERDKNLDRCMLDISF